MCRACKPNYKPTALADGTAPTGASLYDGVTTCDTINNCDTSANTSYLNVCLKCSTS